MISELTPEYLLLESSLYEKKLINNPIEIDNFFFHKSQFETHCTECKKDAIFKSFNIERNRLVDTNPYKQVVYTDYDVEMATKNIQGIHRLTYLCQRDEENQHLYHFFFKVKDDLIMKIGQSPSIADLELHKIKKYRSLLKGDYKDFSKAIGLYSHGIGAGSYVYLRRIFENIINEQKQIALESNPSLSEEEFSKQRMDEKILYIKDYLPDLLVHNRNIYCILSKGIHELSEEQCLELFPKLELGIELILNWKLAEKEKQENEKRFSKFVSDTVQELKG